MAHTRCHTLFQTLALRALYCFVPLDRAEDTELSLQEISKNQVSLGRSATHIMLSAVGHIVSVIAVCQCECILTYLTSGVATVTLIIVVDLATYADAISNGDIPAGQYMDFPARIISSIIPGFIFGFSMQALRRDNDLAGIVLSAIFVIYTLIGESIQPSTCGNVQPSIYWSLIHSADVALVAWGGLCLMYGCCWFVWSASLRALSALKKRYSSSI